VGCDRRDRPRRHLKRSLVLVALLGVAVLVGLSLYADVGSIVDALEMFEWSLLPVALALTSVNYALRFGRWHYYCSRLDLGVPATRSCSVFLAGLTMTVSPAKIGEVMKSVLLHRGFAIPVGRSAPIVVAERLTDGFGIVILAALGVAFVGDAPAWGLIPGAFVVVAVLYLLVRSPLAARSKRLAEAREVAVGLLGIRLFVVMSVVAAFAWSFECLAAYVCVRGMGLHVSFAKVVVMFTVSTLAGALSFLPGGLGVAEASMAAFLHVLGNVPKATAAATTILIRLVTLWFAVAIGLVALAVEDILVRRGTRSARAVQAEGSVAG
jgi:uncharacterized membrane protein YbhN (UPF0104 family)